MLEASSELRLVFQASISKLNWTTPALIVIKRGLNCCVVIMLPGYYIGGVNIGLNIVGLNSGTLSSKKA